MKPVQDVVTRSSNQELLPFVVEVASNSDLHEVAALRASSYGKHMPQMGSTLLSPESYDYDFGCEVFVARSKLDRSLLGTLRVHANVLRPIPLQASIDLPDRFAGKRMVEATRLCVKGSPYSSLVRSALFKALFQYCEIQGVEWIMAAGRRPVDRIYDSLMFSDVAAPGAFYPMAHAGNIPHRVMSLSAKNARAQWSACQHPLYKFVIETAHPDIRLIKAVHLDFAWACPSGYAEVDRDAPTVFSGLDQGNFNGAAAAPQGQPA